MERLSKTSNQYQIWHVLKYSCHRVTSVSLQNVVPREWQHSGIAAACTESHRDIGARRACMAALIYTKVRKKYYPSRYSQRMNEGFRQRGMEDAHTME